MKIKTESIREAPIVFGKKGWARADKENYTDNDQPELSVMFFQKNGDPVFIKASFEDFVRESFSEYRDLDLDNDNFQIGNFIPDARKLIEVLERGITSMQEFMDGKSEECELKPKYSLPPVST